MDINKLTSKYKNMYFTSDELEEFKKNTSKYGFVPISVDSNFNIIDQHYEYWAAKSIGLTEVPINIIQKPTFTKIASVTEPGKYLVITGVKYFTVINIFDYYGVTKVVDINKPHNPAERFDYFHKSNYIYYKLEIE